MGDARQGNETEAGAWQEVSKHTKLRDMRNDKRQQRTESLHMGSQL